MSRPVIALDIDDTLFDHFADIVRWYNEVYGTGLTLANNHPRDDEALREWGVGSIEEAVRRVHAFYDTEEFKSARPYQEALRVLPHLAKQHDIVIVTARDSDILEEFTHQWLNEHLEGSYREVHFTGQYNLSGKNRTKKDVLLEIGAAYLIDDSLSNCIEATEAGAVGLLFGDYPWNASSALPRGIVRLKDWREIETYFDRSGTKSFRDDVYNIVGAIPGGRVMTYGDIAALAGHPYAARQVGGIAHFGPTELPWHRVVNRLGDCASGYYGGKEGHKKALEAEGIRVTDYRIVDFLKIRWRPD